MSSPPAEPRPQRLFFALWPSTAQRESLRRLAAQACRGGGGRPVPADNLHLTLAFLGSVEASTRAYLEAAAAAIHLPPFTLELDQAGYWRRPRVIWLGASQTPEPLQALVRQLRAALLGCGLEPEARPFAAHLTVMRKAVRGPARTEIAPFAWPVDSFALVASQTLPQGASYQVVARWPLDGNLPPSALGG